MKAFFLTICGLTLMMARLSQTLSIEQEITAIQHGSYGSIGDRTWKYHQIYKGMWRGISPDQWDDKIHVKNDGELDISKRDFIVSGLNNTLEDRDLRSLCRSALLCCAVSTGGAGTAIRNKWDEFLNVLTAVNNNKSNIWEFLNQPFIVNLIGSTPAWFGAVMTDKIYLHQIANTPPGSTPNTASGSNLNTAPGSTQSGMPISSCSTQNTELDVALAIVKEAFASAAANPCNYLQTDLTLPDGQVFSLSLASTPKPDKGGCGSPPTIGAPASNAQVAH